MKKRKSNEVIEMEDHYKIILQKGNVCLIDKNDLSLISDYFWYLGNKGYINTVRMRKTISIHRIIMNPVGKEVVDHINMNKADNRRCNLRICSRSQNAINSKKRDVPNPSTKYKNVFIKNSKTQSKYFEAVLTKNRVIYKKNFRSLKDAVLWTNYKGNELWGDFYIKQEFNDSDEYVLPKNYKGHGVKRIGKLGYYGVKKVRGKYVAMFNHAYKRKWIGVFETPQEAAKSYDEYLIKNNLAKDGHKLNSEIKL